MKKKKPILILGILWASLALLSKLNVVVGCDGTLPVVDLSAKYAAFDLVDAMQTWGFSYIEGHTVNE